MKERDRKKKDLSKIIVKKSNSLKELNNKWMEQLNENFIKMKNNINNKKHFSTKFHVNSIVNYVFLFNFFKRSNEIF